MVRLRLNFADDGLVSGMLAIEKLLLHSKAVDTLPLSHGLQVVVRRFERVVHLHDLFGFVVDADDSPRSLAGAVKALPKLELIIVLK